MNFNFGSNVTKAGTVTTTTNPTPAATPGFNPGITTASTGLTFGSATPSSTGFPLVGGGDNQTTAGVKPIAATAPLSSTFSLGTTPAITTSSTGFSGFAIPSTTSSSAPQSSTPGFSFGATSTPSLATTTSAAISFSLTPSTTTTATPSLKLGVTTTPSVGQTTTTSVTTAATTLSTATSLTSSLTSTVPPTAITHVQLEETVNKWSVELEEQEKIFMSQADQINHWDTLLNSNSEKIITLDKEVTAIKLQQQQLDNELEFILAQQRELEEVLLPLEKQAAEMPSNTDAEREHIYHMAETLDTQLKQMSDDLRDIIEHVNESSRTQDYSDPIVQIGRILNAHMNSLQWIDESTLTIQNRLENVTKLHDLHRRKNETSFRISYE